MLRETRLMIHAGRPAVSVSASISVLGGGAWLAGVVKVLEWSAVQCGGGSGIGGMGIW